MATQSAFPSSLFSDLEEVVELCGKPETEKADLLRQLRKLRVHVSRSVPRSKDVLTSKEAADLLGVSSANTVKNWLENGWFPGAKKTPGGHWRFLRSEVEAAKEKMAELARRNEARDMMPPDVDDDGDVPLL